MRPRDPHSRREHLRQRVARLARLDPAFALVLAEEIREAAGRFAARLEAQAERLAELPPTNPLAHQFVVEVTTTPGHTVVRCGDVFAHDANALWEALHKNQTVALTREAKANGFPTSEDFIRAGGVVKTLAIDERKGRSEREKAIAKKRTINALTLTDLGLE